MENEKMKNVVEGLSEEEKLDMCVFMLGLNYEEEMLSNAINSLVELIDHRLNTCGVDKKLDELCTMTESLMEERINISETVEKIVMGVGRCAN